MEPNITRSLFISTTFSFSLTLLTTGAVPIAAAAATGAALAVVIDTFATPIFDRFIEPNCCSALLPGLCKRVVVMALTFTVANSCGIFLFNPLEHIIYYLCFTILAEANNAQDNQLRSRIAAYVF